MTSNFRKARALTGVAVVIAGLLVAGFAHLPILGGLASFLIVEDPLQSAAAIVALGGQTPFREIEAAKLYRAGLAPIVIIVREAPNRESEALQQLGIKKVPEWELGRAVLIHQGVPASAILIPHDEAIGTLEELQAVYKALASQRSVGGEQQAVNSPQSADSKIVSRQERQARQERSLTTKDTKSTKEEGIFRTTLAELRVLRELRGESSPNLERRTPNLELNAPVILVTSKYHTRRTRLTWQYVTGGRSQAIVRAASGDPFDAERWWQQRGFALSVAREYLGLMNYYAGFPVTP